MSHDQYGLGRTISVEADGTAVVVDFGAQRVRISAPFTKLVLL